MKQITISYPGGSLLDIHKKYSEYFYTKKDAWYEKETFAKEKIPKGKYTVNLEAVPDSFFKIFSEQEKLLGKDEIIPPAAIMVYAMIQHKKKTGEYSFENTYVRCSDLVSVGYRVLVGRFDAKGLDVDHYWDGVRYSVLGLASARKGTLETRDLEPIESLNSDFESRISALESFERQVRAKLILD